MKKSSSIVVFVAVFCFLLLPGIAGAVDWSVEPYLKGGNVNFVEKGTSEGNKFFLGGGVRINADSSNFSGNATLEKAQVAESMDEDREIPNRFYAIGAEVAYRAYKAKEFSLSPYIGLAYENWSRISGSWDEMGFLLGSVGVRANYKSVYAGVGTILPFAINANHHSDLDSRLGYQAEVGANIWKGLNATLQYQSLKMGNPQTRLNTTSLMVGYRIPL